MSLFFLPSKEKLKQFQERLVEERKKRLEERKIQRKEDRRNTFYRQKEEEAQRIHEEQLKKGTSELHLRPREDLLCIVWVYIVWMSSYLRSCRL